MTTKSLNDDDLDEEHPLWCVNLQIKELLTGWGASEDHDAIIAFLLSTGLPKGTVLRMHKALLGAEPGGALAPKIEAEDFEQACSAKLCGYLWEDTFNTDYQEQVTLSVAEMRYIANLLRRDQGMEIMGVCES